MRKGIALAVDTVRLADPVSILERADLCAPACDFMF
jgi:hypothetical protein